MIEKSPSAHLATAFHTAFAGAYVQAARHKYPRLVGLLPYHGQDVHIIHGGNRWWQILCIPGQSAAMCIWGRSGFSRCSLLTR
jgi:hypothetical protein